MKNDRADGERDDLQYNEEGERLVQYWLHPILPTLRSTFFFTSSGAAGFVVVNFSSQLKEGRGFKGDDGSELCPSNFRPYQRGFPRKTDLYFPLPSTLLVLLAYGGNHP